MSPKSSTDELATLREIVFDRDQGCRWPGCDYPLDEWTNPLQLCHLSHRGMGGRTSVNTPQHTVALCRAHHDVFDGRTGQLKAHIELASMLRSVAGLAES